MKFSDDRIKRIMELSEESKADAQKTWSPKTILQKFDEIIIGNAKYKKTLASCLAAYMDEQKQRDHLLVFGPSGSGKTYLLEKALPEIGLSYHVVDSSSWWEKSD